MDIQSQFGKILEKLLDSKAVEVRLSRMESPEEFFVRGIVSQCLAHIDRLYWKNTVLQVVRELMRNAEDVVASRALKNTEAEKESGGKLKKILQFYRDSVAASDKKEILVRAKLEDDSAIIDIANAGQLSQEQMNLIRSRIEAGDKAENLEQTDRGEGRGPGGLAVSVIAMKRAGIPVDSIKVRTGNNVTMVSLHLSANRELKEKLEYIEKTLLEEVEALPSLPDNINRIIQMCESGTSSLEQIADEISKDQGIAGEIMKLANSGAFAGGNIGDVFEAVKILGISNINGILLKVGAFKVLAERYKSSKILLEYPADVGSYSRFIARRFNQNAIAERALTAGLLHHIGAIVLYSVMRHHPAFDNAMEERNPDTIITMEELEWGISHATLGGLLAQKWKFPDDLAEAIQYHHAPHLASQSHRPLINIVYMADAVFHNQEHPENFYSLDTEVLRFFDLTSFEAFQMICTTLNPTEAKKKEEEEQ